MIEAVFTQEELYGSWASEGLEMTEAFAGLSWRRRELTIMDGTWTLRITFLEKGTRPEEACRLIASGNLQVGPPAVEDDAARYTDFNFDKRCLTPLNASFARLLASAQDGPPWGIGEERDVSRRGCLFVPSVWNCPTEYCLIKLDAEKLYMAERCQDFRDRDGSAHLLDRYPLSRSGE